MNIAIAVDIDGVLSDFLEQWYKVVNQLYPDRIPPGYAPQDFWHSDMLSREEAKLSLDKTFQIYNFWLTLSPLKAVERLARVLPLTADYLSIYYVTHRPETPGMPALAQTKMWLSKHNLLTSNTSVIVVPDSKAKPAIYSALHIKLSLDDRADTVQNCLEIPGHIALLYDASWSRADVSLSRIRYVENFLLFSGVIAGMPIEYLHSLDLLHLLDWPIDCNPSTCSDTVY